MYQIELLFYLIFHLNYLNLELFHLITFLNLSYHFDLVLINLNYHLNNLS